MGAMFEPPLETGPGVALAEGGLVFELVEKRL